MKLMWNVRAFDVKDEKRNLYSPLFEDRREADLWKMKFITENPNDIILFDLENEDGTSATTEIGAVISEMWKGHEWPKTR